MKKCNRPLKLLNMTLQHVYHTIDNLHQTAENGELAVEEMKQPVENR